MNAEKQYNKAREAAITAMVADGISMEDAELATVTRPGSGLRPVEHPALDEFDAVASNLLTTIQEERQASRAAIRREGKAAKKRLLAGTSSQKNADMMAVERAGLGRIVGDVADQFGGAYLVFND